MIVDLLKTLAPYMQWIGVVSLLTFSLSIIIIPLGIGRLSHDFFLRYRKKRLPSHLNAGTIVMLIIRNSLGVVLIIAGILMLFLPGQGILTILIGFVCMAFPGKRHFILYLIDRKSLQRSLNWIRQKMKRPPFVWH